MFRRKKDFQLKMILLGHSYNDIYLFIIPLLLPFFRMEFSFSYFQSGIIMAIHVALRSIFSLIFGFIGDKYNHKSIFIATGFVVSSILLGVIVLINRFSLIITILLLMAISVSTFHPLATAILGEKTKPGKQGRNFSLFNAAGTFGLVIMSLLFGWLVQFWGWKIACLIISIPGFLLSWFYFKVKKEPGKKIIAAEKTDFTNKIMYANYFISHGLCSLGTWAILSFLPIYATEYIGINPNISAWFLTLFCLFELSGSLLMSKILDRNQPLKFIIFATITISFLLLALTWVTVPVILILIVAGLGLMQSFYYPSQHTWITMATPNHIHGKVFGFIFFVEGLSATIAPFLYGLIADNFGIVFAYRMAAVPFFAGFLLYLYLHTSTENAQSTKVNTVPIQ